MHPLTQTMIRQLAALMVDQFPGDTHHAFAWRDARLATFRDVVACVGDTLNPQLDPGGSWFRDAVEQQAAAARQASRTADYAEGDADDD